MKNLCVIGTGYVGLVNGTCFVPKQGDIDHGLLRRVLNVNQAHDFQDRRKRSTGNSSYGWAANRLLNTASFTERAGKDTGTGRRLDERARVDKIT